MEIKEQIDQWLLPLLQEQNLFLVEVRALGTAKIEVFIDGDDGIKISQCAEISRFLEKHLDGSSLVSPNYTLDVSSPGMTNPLRVPRQYRKRIGRILDIVKNDGKELMLELVAADDEKITARTVVAPTKKPKKGKPIVPTEESVEMIIKYDEIKRALIQMNW